MKTKQNKSQVKFATAIRMLLSVCMCFLFLFGQKSFSADSNTGESPLQVRNAVGTVLLSGLVGGVLGLSTLSFYANPEDNIRNIYFGAGAGMIIATIWMTMNVATSPIPNIDSPTAYVAPKNLVSPWLSEKNQIGLAYSHKF